MATQAIARYTTNGELLPAVEGFSLPSPEETRTQLQVIRAFQSACRELMIPGSDYGTIPGTQKPTLLKPGAEKLVRLLGLADEYQILEQTKDWDKGFFHFTVQCRLVHLASGQVVTTGMGECNSMEARYRWRWLWERELPAGFNKQGAVYRNTKNGGKQYRTENEDIYSQVNTCLKMSMKRALVSAALSAGRLSEVFTQDMEDFADAAPELSSQAPAPDAPTPATNARHVPQNGAGGPPAPRVVSTSARCEIHAVKLARHPTLGMVHKLPDGTFCPGTLLQGSASPENGDVLPENGGIPADLPPSQATDLEGLQAAVRAANLTWERFEADYLKMPWPEWVKLGGGIGGASMRLRGEG